MATIYWTVGHQREWEAAQARLYDQQHAALVKVAEKALDLEAKLIERGYERGYDLGFTPEGTEH